MEVEPHKFKIRAIAGIYNEELSRATGFSENPENESVVGWDGKLDIRPPYQREFIYKMPRQKKVIESIMKGFPINILYFVDREDGTFEVLDGQQRIMSICRFINNGYSLDDKRGIANMHPEEREKIYEYELTVYICKGTNSEKIDWFEIVNEGGMELSKQEMRNAVFSGRWVTDAKRYFGRPTSPAYNAGKNYISGDVERQEYLETAIIWIKGNRDDDIKEYMAEHQHDKDAKELWNYFQSVIDWIKKIFPEQKPRKEMKSVSWGILYKKYKDAKLDIEAINAEVKELMIDDEVTSKNGIYSYVLTRDKKHLNLRSFTEAQRRQVYEKQGGKCKGTGRVFDSGICKKCKKHFDFKDMDADHITPWNEGGKTEINNCQMLCKTCNRTKGDR